MAESNLPDKILIVDDDPTVAGAVKEPLSKYNIIVHAAKDLDSALYIFNQNRFDVVCVELDFEPQPGLVLVQKWRNHELFEKRHVGIILLLGNRNDQASGDQKLMKELRDIEALPKPFSAIQLLPMLSRAKAAKQRSLGYEDLRQRTAKIGEHPDKFEKAIAMIKKELPSLGTRGLEMMVEMYEKHSRFEEANEINDQLLSKDSNHVGHINTRGRLLLKMGRHEEALQVMEKADEAAPNNIQRLNQLAEMYLKLNNPDSAVDKMKKLIDFHPETPDLKFDMFSKLYDHGFDEHAQSLCKQTTSPIEVVRYYNNKGVALNKAGNKEGALMEYERSLQFYPNFKENYRILYNVALAQVGFKNRQSYEVAHEYLNECRKLKPDFEKALKTLQQVEKALASKTKKKKASS